MLIYAYNALLISLCHLGLALFVFLRDPRRSINLYFSLCALSIASWSLGLYQHTLAPDIENARFWDLYLHLSSIFIPWSLLHFTLQFARWKRDLWVSLIDLFTGAVFILFLSQPGWFLIEVTDKPHFNYFPVAAPGYILYSLAFFAALVYTVRILISTFRSSESILQREQIKYILLAILIGFGGGSTNIFAVFVKSIYPVGCYFVAIFACILAATIVKHTLMDIDVFIRRGLLYLGLLIVLLIPSYLLILYFETLFLSKVDVPLSLTIMCVFLAFAYCFYKLNQIVEPKLIRLSSGGYNYEQIINRINYGINHFPNLNDLLDYLARIITETISVKHVAILIEQRDGSYTPGAASAPLWDEAAFKNYSPSEVFLKALVKKEKIFIKDDILARIPSKIYSPILNELKRLHAEMILPIQYEESLAGMLVVGPKEKNILFSKHDVDVLNLFAVHLGSILNIESYKVIESLNVHLQEKTRNLETAMADLKNAQSQLVHSEKLASVGGLAAGVAHEINNALNAAVLGHMHLKELLNKASSDLEVKELLKDAKDDIRILSNGMDRAHQVVKNLLTFSQKNSEGFRDLHVNEGIESTLQIVQNQLKGHIKIHKELCQQDSVFCDLSQLNQVFLNLIKNASDMMDEAGNIWIKTYRDTTHFIISIRDDGPGIPKEIQDKIFDPFFSTKGVGKGTGLGLSVSYNIIKNHHGVLTLKSEPGEGAEFKIEIPLKQVMEQSKNEQRKAV